MAVAFGEDERALQGVRRNADDQEVTGEGPSGRDWKGRGLLIHIVVAPLGNVLFDELDAQSLAEVRAQLCIVLSKSGHARRVEVEERGNGLQIGGQVVQDDGALGADVVEEIRFGLRPVVV